MVEHVVELLLRLLETRLLRLLIALLWLLVALLRSLLKFVCHNFSFFKRFINN